MTAPDLAAIVEASATMMLGLNLRELVDDGAAPHHRYGLGASVGFTGDWDGPIVVGCDATLGREAAAAMFGSAPDTFERV